MNLYIELHEHMRHCLSCVEVEVYIIKWISTLYVICIGAIFLPSRLQL